MKRLIDKFILILFCVAVLMQHGTDFEFVGALLCGVIFSCTAQIFGKSRFSGAVLLIYSLLCVAIPSFLIASPLIVYDIVFSKYYLLLAAFPISAAVNFLDIKSYVLMIFVGTIIAAAAETKTEKLIEMNSAMINFRDTSHEKTLSLEEKNKQLISRQEHEIYLATLRERNRIAREIHDNVGHMLTRSILQLGALSILNKDENISEGLTSLSETLNNAMTSIRTSVHDLHDDSIALKPAIDDCIRSVEDKFDVSCEYDISRDIPKNIKFCFIGIVKEGLSNAVKHSSGNRVKILIREHPALYQLILQDNGKCNEYSPEKSGGMGLQNMRDRVEAIGGKLNISSGSKGFRIFVSVPRNKLQAGAAD